MTAAPSPALRPTTSADWWRGAVIYQIYPRSFADSNGDGVGDLPGIIEKLPYVAGLGVDAIWISPFFRSPMKDFGYDVSDYRDVDPLFGTLADFDRLIARAHELGLKVVIDQVMSHTSEAHPWFTESRSSRDNPRADWYVWADARPDGTPPNNWLSVFGGSAWQWDSRRAQYYLHNFLASQPDLNFHCPAVQQQLLDDVRFWLERGVDGFRFDACNFHFHDRGLQNNPPAPPRTSQSGTGPQTNPYEMQRHLHDKNQPENLAFLERVRALLDEYGAASVGEIGDANALEIMVDYTSGRRLHMTYSFGLLNKDVSAAHIRNEVEQFQRAASAPGAGGWPCWTVGNHDSQRVMTRWGHDAGPAFARVANALLLSLRGSVCLYQGDELGLPEAEVPFEQLQDPYGIAFWPAFKGRDGCRTPMPWQQALPNAGFSGERDVKPWLPVLPSHAALAVEASEQNASSPLHFVRAFLHWRKEMPALVDGSLRFIDTPEPVLGFVRGDAVLALFNLGGAPQRIDLGNTPASTAVTPPSLPTEQLGRRNGTHIDLPAYGIYFGRLTG